MRKLGKVARLGLAGLMALPLSLGGCMSMQPVRDQQGNVIVDQYGNPMYRPQFDAGKTARVVGGGILGTVAGAHHAGKIVDYDAANKAALMGRGMQMIGNSNREHYVHQGGGWPASQPFQQYQPEDKIVGTAVFDPQRGAWVMNPSNQNNGYVYLKNQPVVRAPENQFFACNRWDDRNGDGLFDMTEVIGEKDTFQERERVQVVANIFNRTGSKVKFTLLNEGGDFYYEKDFESTIPTANSFAHHGWELGLPRGNYIVTWSADGEVLGSKHFSVQGRDDFLRSPDPRFVSYPLQNQFFAYSRWDDLNGNGSRDDGEFIGIKSVFEPGERILMTARIYGRKGSDVRFKMVDGDEKVIYQRTLTLPYLYSAMTTPWERGLPEGNYVGTWSVGEEVLGRTEFSVGDE
jgi:hypothetical protein